LRDLRLGDDYPTGPGEEPSPTIDVDGYAECMTCGLDFGARVKLVGGRIDAVLSEPDTLVHGADGELAAPLKCPACATESLGIIGLYRGRDKRAYRMGDVYRPTLHPDATELRGRATCANCESIFAVVVQTRAGRLVSARVDANQSDTPPGVHTYAPEYKGGFSLSRG
jgi:transcription elongation factor Elf1